ncbi:hypothetical protein BKA80DRAFT_123574 [Phyllosticta citrichinensis]
MSKLNAGGWSTESPTEDQASYITAFATSSIEELLGDARGILDKWPFGYMKCLQSDHPDNWWPLRLAIPTIQDIKGALLEKKIARGILSDLETPAVSNPPLCFSALRAPFSMFTIDGGQLVRENKTTLSTTYTASTGMFDYDLDHMEFSRRKDPLDGRSDVTATSATMIFSKEEPLGVLFDFEADTKNRLIFEEDGSIIVISSYELDQGAGTVCNVMLVKRVADGYERVAQPFVKALVYFVCHASSG